MLLRLPLSATIPVIIPAINPAINPAIIPTTTPHVPVIAMEMHLALQRHMPHGNRLVLAVTHQDRDHRRPGGHHMARPTRNKDIGNHGNPGQFASPGLNTGLAATTTFTDPWHDDMPTPKLQRKKTRTGGLAGLFSRKPKPTAEPRTPIDAHHGPTKTRYQVVVNRGPMAVSDIVGEYDTSWEADQVARNITGASVHTYTIY